MRRKKWLITKGDKELASYASEQLNIDPLAALILSSRGLNSAEELETFFDKNSPMTVDPFSIRDMDRAAARINRALDNFEMICVYGDYDADGVTATALLYSFLESRGANVTRYIPDRINEGYGLNNDAIDKLKERGVKLIVTVDNGATAIDEVAHAYEAGLEVVVTDHHKVGDTLPECAAVVDPQRSDCTCPFKEMAGVGVAFKLACAIEGDSYDEILEEYGELVAIGTIGDVVSLTGENRVMVRRGINAINEHPGIGVSALIQAAGIGDRYITSSSVAFTLCPRINAAGRMGSADIALELLLCDDPETAGDIAQRINTMNYERQTTENGIFVKAVSLMEENPDILNKRIIVVDGEDWNQGVIGIVAAKLTEKYGRPSVVISRSGDEAKGSCRSIPGFSIYEAIDSVSDILTHYGGHTLAAGIGLKSSDIDLFRKRINEYAADKEMPFAVQRIDCKLQLGSVNVSILSSLEGLEPFGADNPQPVFGLFGVTIEDINGIAEGGKHIRLLVSKNGSRLTAVYFNMPQRRFPFEKGDVVDLAVNLEKNVYNDELRVSTVIRGIRPSVTDETKVLENISLYGRFSGNEKITPSQAAKLMPGRDIQSLVYKSVKANPVKDGFCEMLCVRMGDDGENLGRYMTAVDSMLEAGVLACDDDGRLFAPQYSGKANLDESPTMKKLRAFSV